MKIEHVSIWTEDLERMKTFYKTYFGATSNDKYINSKKQFQSYFLTFESGARLEIMQRPDIQIIHKSTPEKEYIGYAHLAISVGSEEKVNQLTETLKKDGYPVLDGPRKTGDGYYESVISDPDGNRVEITI